MDCLRYDRPYGEDRIFIPGSLRRIPIYESRASSFISAGPGISPDRCMNIVV